jgi:hypothetical protein
MVGSGSPARWTSARNVSRSSRYARLSTCPKGVPWSRWISCISHSRSQLLCRFCALAVAAVRTRKVCSLYNFLRSTAGVETSPAHSTSIRNMSPTAQSIASDALVCRQRASRVPAATIYLNVRAFRLTGCRAKAAAHAHSLAMATYSRASHAHSRGCLSTSGPAAGRRSRPRSRPSPLRL